GLTTRGWSTPEERIEAASSSSAWPSKLRRGCWGFGIRLSTGSSRSRTPSSVSAVGRRAPRPRPSARFITLDDLLRQLQVGDRAGGPEIVLEDGAAVAGCLRESNIAGNHGREHLTLEIALDLRAYLCR